METGEVVRKKNKNSYKQFLYRTVLYICLLFGVAGGVLIFGSTGAAKVTDLDDEKLYVEGNYEYKVSEGAEGRKYARITKYLGNELNVVVPDMLGGYPVYEVMLFTMDQADEERLARIESVVFPDTMVNLHGMACMWFENLTSVTIPEGTECIGGNSFLRCFALKQITIPASVTYIPGNISDNDEIEYSVQSGSYADKYLTEAGKKVVRTGTAIPVVDLSIAGQKEYEKQWRSSHLKTAGKHVLRHLLCLPMRQITG